MIKNKRVTLILSVIFLSLECILGVMLHTVQGIIDINLRYLSVILACGFFVIFAEKSRRYAFTQIGLICTVCADYFLVYLADIKQLPAMIFFSVTQISYFLRLYFDDTNATRRKWHVIIRASVSVAVIAVTAAVLGESCDALALVSMFYYANIVLNLVFAFADFKNNRIFAIGILLFVLCDTVIGLSFVNSYLPVNENSFIYKIIYPGFDLAWVFYLPSQALIAVSLIKIIWQKDSEQSTQRKR